MILTIRTDNPEAEVGLFKPDGSEVVYNKWQAHRELEATLLLTIEKMLDKTKTTKKDLKGIVVYAGPGSFTGLRIGFTVTNTLAAGLNIANVKSGSDDWIADGIKKLSELDQPQILLPDYGGEANITKPRK
jgi:tRNA threonylcarbamoyladenosine biosynthesis protein TsaB